MTLAQFKAIAWEQFYIFLLDPEAALEAIPGMLPPDMNERQKAFKGICDLLSASGELSGETLKRLNRIEHLFGIDSGNACRISEPAAIA